MDDTTTEEVQDQVTGEEISAPETLELDTAENDYEETQTSPEVSDDDPEIDDVQEYASKKGLPLDDPIKLAKIIRDNERKISEQGLKNSELSKSIESVNGYVDESDLFADTPGVPTTDIKYSFLEFRVNNPEFKVNSPEADAMADIIANASPSMKPYLASNLDLVHDMAQAKLHKSQLRDAENKGRQEERRALASKGRASAPSSSATTQEDTQTITAENVDALIAKNGTDWYFKNYDKINEITRAADLGR